MAGAVPIPEDRPLTDEESALVRWLLLHGTPSAVRFLPQLDEARVVSRCSCGCASIDFAIGGDVPPPGTPLEILADYEWLAGDGAALGVFVFARCDLLAGLEVWSIDGLSSASTLPTIEQLRPLAGPATA